MHVITNPKVMDRGLQIHNLRLFLARNGIAPDTVDVHALVDSTLRYPENLQIIAKHVGLALMPRDYRDAEKRIKEQFCLTTLEACHGTNKSACEAYTEHNCIEVTGDIEETTIEKTIIPPKTEIHVMTVPKVKIRKTGWSVWDPVEA